MYVHLKDKQKIRHRKRWSQVMYMYYLLGHRLWDKPIRRSVKEEVAYNTYILTLDGDVDFKPEAVLLLVDLMRRNFGVGAACGRIHPEGNGPMVWYQKFEYAISHWLQKTTEHVLGCVLCSPGCFSLFRASALMDDNVMKTYSKTAEEALHYVQYDQGEDRWLCTLLLQRGYRVEYSAAADALTYAPESFNEFFNQRRRWTPSTFANILDLLSTGRATAKRNQNISILYILYQAGLMFSSIVGPATILLMVVSAFDSVFRSLSITDAFFIVFVPVAVFFALCMLAKQGIQLAFAALLGALFATSQMVVLVGLIIGIAEDGLCSPTSWFLLGTTAIFVISGIFHPQEMTVLIHGLLYFLMIPTMYLLLIIYSLCNLHVVSWGTREVVQTNVEKEKLKQREMELAVQQVSEASKNNKDATGLLGKLGGLLGSSGGAGGAEDGWTWSCGDMFRCLCCPRPGESPTDKKISKLEKQIALLTAKISRLVDEKNDNDGSTSESEPDERAPLLDKQDTSSISSQNSEASDAEKTDEDKSTSESDEKVDDSGSDGQPEIKYSDSKPYWAQDINAVGRGPVGTISDKEEDFWKHLIRRYLLPIDKNPEREERIKKELLALRNKAVIAFFMINILFMVLFMSLAATDPVKPPEGTLGNETNLPSSSYYINFYCTNPVSGDTEMQFIEPIGFAFLMVFGSFLVIQFIGMLFHRLFSLLQVVSSEVLCKKRTTDEPKDFLELTKKLAKMDEDCQTADTVSISSSADSLDVSNFTEPDSDGESDGEGPAAERRNYRRVFGRLNSQPKVFKTMDKTFARRFLALNQQVSKAVVAEQPVSVPAPDIPRRRRLSSVFQRPANLPVLQHRGPSDRRQSVANNLVMELKRKQTEIFTPQMQERIRERFKISDKEIKREESRMKRLIAGSSFVSTDAEEDFESNQERSNYQQI